MKEHDFDTIWKEYIIPMRGQTLVGHSGQKNKIVNVNMCGLTRISKNNLQSTIPIEVFRWTVEELFLKGRVTRAEIHTKFPLRVSSCVVMVLSKLECFKEENNPLALVYERGRPVGLSVDESTRNEPVDKVIKSEVSEQKAESMVLPLSEVDRELMQGTFVSVADLESKKNLDAKGLYCIRLRSGVALPSGYRCENKILYIGIATQSLRKRLWGQELHAEGHGTFFRSVGAMLGLRPPKGSLVRKQNKSNYKFTLSDEREIIKWLERSTLVNCVEFDGDFDEVEGALIKKYTPLLNIQKNPCPSECLKHDRDECRLIALSE